MDWLSAEAKGYNLEQPNDNQPADMSSAHIDSI